MKSIRKIHTLLFVVVVALIFSTCEKDKEVPISTVKVDITKVTPSYRNVLQRGSFVSNATITSAELHYTNDSSFADYKTLALSVGKDKSYTATIAPLQQGATYYVRYKVANSYSSVLLPQIDTLHTLAYTLPKVTTDSVGGITASSFVGYGTLVDWGCDSLSEFGFCYGNSANPTIEGKHIVCTEKDNHFSGTVTGLEDGATYYMRTYAANPMGIAYGEDIKFSTLRITKPTVVTSDVTDITASSAVCGGKITSNGNSEITECGICYSKTAEPTIDDKTLVCKQDNAGEFSGTLTGLNEGTAYHVRAYAVNAKGVAYGEDYRFTTKSTTAPTVTTTMVTDITISSAVCGGKIVSDGYSEITECGICYSTSAEPTIDDKTLVCKQDKAGKFSGALTGLSEATTYYVRAYATNAKGTGYSEERSFTTTKSTTVPTVTTNAVTDINVSSAMCGGKIVSDGYSEITACGICYSTSAEPTIDDKTVVCKQGDNGEFSTELTGLSKGTTYYVCAYATNAKGTAYGETVMFKTTAHAWVDLGLSVKWATCNVGATKPEEYGNHYAWGETTTKDYYSWPAYKYGSSASILTKYCSQSSYGKDGFTDDLTTLEAADDAATVNWGSAWRMPTLDEWDELINNCDWTWTDNYNGTGIAGHIVVSKTNGNSIFLPAAGYRYVGDPYSAGSHGCYWSSSLSANYPDGANGVSFDSYDHGAGIGHRCCGRSVRPVCE